MEDGIGEGRYEMEGGRDGWRGVGRKGEDRRAYTSNGAIIRTMQ